jgi:hypothetical protein
VEGGLRRDCMLLNINGLMGAAWGRRLRGSGVSIGKWFFMNDLLRGGGRPWESGHLGGVKQSAAKLVFGWKCFQNQWVGRMSGAWRGGRAVRRGRVGRL